MADIPFSIGGYEVHCPNFDKSTLNAGGEGTYRNGSPVYFGSPSFTFVWDYIPVEDITVIRGVYNSHITINRPTNPAVTPVSVTIPDPANGGLRSTDAFMAEPSGSAGGDGTKNFSVTFYGMHQSSFQTAQASPGGNYYDADNLKVGTTDYYATTWQF